MSKFREQEPLGREVVRTREEMLAQLRPVVQRRGRRRVAVRAGAAVALLAGVSLGAVRLSGLLRQPSDRSQPRLADVGTTRTASPAAADVERTHASREAGPPQAERASTLELVATTEGLATRVGAVTTASTTSATDDDLISALRATGQDPGIVRVDGRVVIAGDFGR